MCVFSVFDEIHGFGCSQSSLMIRNSILVGIESFFVLLMPSLATDIIHLAFEKWFLKVSVIMSLKIQRFSLAP